MGVRGLNHFNITAPADVIERVRDFYVEVLGLYAGAEAVVHLTCEGEDSRTPHARSAFDHVAFSCEGLREIVERLERSGVAYELDEVASLGQVQLFLRDPAGVGLELNFTGEQLAREESA
jgi:catechol 2,3-dioxygenase-like lactoylglutathione lyase family enzyme